MQDQLVDKKLKVVIPGISENIILEADEVTDASFVSTHEVDEHSQPDQRSVNDDIILSDLNYEIEESSTPYSTTPATHLTQTQKEYIDALQHNKIGKISWD